MIRRRNPRYYKGEFKDILGAIFSNRIASGDDTDLFEKKFAQYIGAKFAIATCSGRNALSLLLDAFGLKEGDEVIMPAYTLKDLVYLIKEKGLIPKLVDIEKDSFNINPQLIPGQITPKSKVILATHIFGLACDMEKILEIAKKYNLIVIEDCAHALGTRLNKKPVGSYADAAFFSFETIKAINTFGGGIIVTNNEKITQNVKDSIKNYPNKNYNLPAKIFFSYLEDLAIKSPFYPLIVRAFMNKITTKIISKIYLSVHNTTRVKKTRFTDLQALLGLKQLDFVDSRNKLRKSIADKLKNKLAEGILLQEAVILGDRTFYFFVIKLLNPKYAIEEFRRELIAQGLDCGIKNEITDNCAKYLGQEERFPITKEIYESTLQLPLYDNLTDEEVSKIAGILNQVITKGINEE